MSLWCVSWRRRGVLGCIISVVWRWRRRGGVIVSRPPGWWTCVVMVHYSSIIEDHSWNKRCKDCKAGVTISTNSREYIKKKKKKIVGPEKQKSRRKRPLNTDTYILYRISRNRQQKRKIRAQRPSPRHGFRSEGGGGGGSIGLLHGHLSVSVREKARRRW